MPKFRGNNSRYLRLFVGVALFVAVSISLVWFFSEDSISSKKRQCTSNSCTLWGHSGALKAPFTLEETYGPNYYAPPHCGGLDTRDKIGRAHV